jgi:hypothetical protein
VKKPDQSNARKLAKSTDDLELKSLLLRNGLISSYPEYNAYRDSHWLLAGLPAKALSKIRLRDAEALMFEAPRQAI